MVDGEDGERQGEKEGGSKWTKNSDRVTLHERSTSGGSGAPSPSSGTMPKAGTHRPLSLSSVLFYYESRDELFAGQMG